MNSKYFKNFNSYNCFINKYNKKFFNILSVNIRSVSSISKFNKFKYELSKFKELPDIIAIQETWFDKQCINLYSIFGYEVVNCCRKDGYGGTSVFVKSVLNYKVKQNLSEEFLDIISIELPDVKIMNKPLTIVSAYRSQKCTVLAFLKQIEDLLVFNNGVPCFFVGDINIDMLCNNRDKNLLNNLFSEFDMHSCHNLVTRPLSGTSIDCVFTNLSNQVYICSIESNLTDHNMINCNLDMEFMGQDVMLNIPKGKYETDYNKFKSYLDNNLLNENLSCYNSSDLCKSLINNLSAAAIHSTKITTKSLNVRKKLTPWISDNLLNLISLKDNLLKARRKNRSDKSILDRLKRISRIIKISNNKLMNEYYSYNLENCCGDPKKTWQFLNKALGRNRAGIKSIVKQDGCVLTKDEDKVEALNDFFVDIVDNMQTNITINSSDDINCFRTLMPERTTFELKKVNGTKVESILNTLDNKKKSGL